MPPVENSLAWQQRTSKKEVPCQVTVCAEIITEFILERAGPVILKTFLLELKALRLTPVIFLQEEL